MIGDPHATAEALAHRIVEDVEVKGIHVASTGYGYNWAKDYIALAADLASVRADLDAMREALREARDGLREALDYGLRWPIGLDTDPQEQRGMDRDTFIRNTELGIQQIDAALAAGTEGERDA